MKNCKWKTFFLENMGECSNYYFFTKNDEKIIIEANKNSKKREMATQSVFEICFWSLEIGVKNA
jgi:hypothetical protein